MQVDAKTKKSRRYCSMLLTSAGQQQSNIFPKFMFTLLTFCRIEKSRWNRITNLRWEFIWTFWANEQFFCHMNCKVLFKTCQASKSFAAFRTRQVIFVMYCHVQAQVCRKDICLWTLGTTMWLVIIMVFQVSPIFV